MISECCQPSCCTPAQDCCSWLSPCCWTIQECCKTYQDCCPLSPYTGYILLGLLVLVLFFLWRRAAGLAAGRKEALRLLARNSEIAVDRIADLAENAQELAASTIRSVVETAFENTEDA